MSATETTSPPTCVLGPRGVALPRIPFHVDDDSRLTDPEALGTLVRTANRHLGEACFILGNGPSLRTMRLSRLEGWCYFGVNRGYLAYALGLPRIPYLVIGDQDLYRVHAAEVRAAGVGERLYQTNVCRTPEYLASREQVIRFPFHFAPAMDEGYFATDVTRGVHRGFTVVLSAVQLAYFMGFHAVYLLGCDMAYTADDMHFYPNGVFDQARRDATCNMPRVFRAFEVARHVFEQDGRRLVNVTPGSALDVLPRDDFERVVSRAMPPRG